jgi:hypothetical protein
MEKTAEIKKRLKEFYAKNMTAKDAYQSKRHERGELPIDHTPACQGLHADK